ncbi:type II secretion system F family protein [Ramlibacter rhizophilus]|uniref:Type II secretion system F family protein n=1 Tax=Ramlibacter rhizophilus TaxID=1781167 RepID=A0A4Z0BCH5_9BURK|nr:type II secretion system F family protein [Ramlibacter rhizophilus]TFY96902.1 type II secretion system F family protein [Ramlibacter rhizophilus]
MLIISTLVFLSCTLAVGALLLWVTPTRTQHRLTKVLPSRKQGNWSQAVVKAADRISRLTAPEGDWESSPIRIRLLNAGIRNSNAKLVFFAAKSVLPFLFAAASFAALRSGNIAQMTTLLLIVLSAALVGIYLPNLVLHFLVKARQREIFESFPDAADLMLVCVEAGLGLDASINKVAEEMNRKSPAVSEELALTNLEMRAGVSRDKAVRNLATRTGVEEISIFASMLTQADKFGTSIGECMRVFSDDLRHKRQIRAEEKAAKIPVKMLFPLVLCIFPAIIMVILGPVIIQVTRTLLPMLGAR